IRRSCRAGSSARDSTLPVNVRDPNPSCEQVETGDPANDAGLPTTVRQLALLPSLGAELAQADTVEQVASIDKKAAALVALAKSIGIRGRKINMAARLRIEAMAKAGEMLAATVKHGGSRFRAGTLPEGIDKKKSHRWQAVARVPLAERERY